MLIALLALTAAALFTGAAVYISIAEHPARLGLTDSAALAQWQPSYKAAVPMQAGLALVSALLGIWAWLDQGESLYLVAALLIFAVIPFTFFGPRPRRGRRLRGRDRLRRSRNLPQLSSEIVTGAGWLAGLR